MGVITLCDIDYGRIFGPFPTQLTLMDPTYVIGMLTQDKRSDGPMIEVDPDVNNGLARANEWLAYIQPARDEEEQNVEAYMKNGQVFYRTLRIIKAKEELFVWYSKDFCQLIDMPEVKRSTMQENVNYVCQACGEMFHHVFPLRAHMRFKCEERNNSHSRDKSQQSVSPNRTYDVKHSSEITIRKRHIQNDDDDRVGGKVFITNNNENDSSSIIPKSPEKDVNANIQVENTCDGRNNNPSAFRKVEKSFSTTNSHDTINFVKSQHIDTGYRKTSELSDIESVRMMSTSKEFISHPGLVSSMLQTQHSMVPAPVPSPVHDPQMRASMIEAYRYSFPQQYAARPEALMRSIRVGISHSKTFPFADKLNSSMPFAKSGNPMVETMVQNSAPALLSTPVASLPVPQNWCAKCNASFRMTSDLVYHMRSHHKREFDPVKKKRDDKLKCTICNETFRERHHLTRHMTSHA